MNRDQFLSALSRRLANISAAERDAVLNYYRELLDDNAENGMSESEAIASLEPVDVIAGRILEGTPAVRTGRRSTLFIRILALPFGLVLGAVALALALALLATVWALIIAALAVELALIAVFVVGILGGIVRACNMLPTGLAMIGLGVFAGGLAILLSVPLMKLPHVGRSAAARFKRLVRQYKRGRSRGI